MKEKEPVFKKFQSLQKSKNDLLSRISDLSTAQLNTPQIEGKWSIAQVLYHVYLAEKLSLQYMKKKTSDLSQVKPSGVKEAFKSILLQITLRLPIKFKAPKAIADSLPEEIEWNDFLLNWGDTRDELYKFIEWLPQEALNKSIFRHPRTGMMSMTQTIDFYRAHFNHHVPQVMAQLELIRNNTN